MEYTELEKMYKFSLENDLGITKHNVKVPSVDTARMLVNKFDIKKGAEKRIQILDDRKNISFVFNVGSITLFETVCSPYDEYKIDEPEEDEE